MGLFEFFIIYALETLLRAFPVPCKRGLFTVGQPGRDSPVFLTCNYHLTVAKVRRALKGMDAHLLVANSKGINVWCAATGGLFTNHDVISALKTSGIEGRVDHKTVILPQLAATGVEAAIIKKRAGWKVIWGPVYAKDIGAFMENRGQKTPEMSTVVFPWLHRMEMAVAWAFPISVVSALIVLPFGGHALCPVVGLVWGSSFLIFLFFPLYGRWLRPRGKRIGFVFFDFGRGGVQLILWGAVLLGFIVYSIVNHSLTLMSILPWGLISLVVVFVLSIDLMGSTPLYKSSLHKDRLLRVKLDAGRCRGAGVCMEVCPRNCYELSGTRKLAFMTRADQCVQCGACIVQCPFDALYFESASGVKISPEEIRRFKLNLVGKRVVRIP